MAQIAYLYIVFSSKGISPSKFTELGISENSLPNILQWNPDKVNTSGP